MEIIHITNYFYFTKFNSYCLYKFHKSYFVTFVVLYILYILYICLFYIFWIFEYFVYFVYRIHNIILFIYRLNEAVRRDAWNEAFNGMQHCGARSAACSRRQRDAPCGGAAPGFVARFVKLMRLTVSFNCLV